MVGEGVKGLEAAHNGTRSPLFFINAQLVLHLLGCYGWSGFSALKVARDEEKKNTTKS